MDSFSTEKEILVRDLASGLENLKGTLPRSVKSQMLEIYESKSNTLVSLIESNYFINDKELDEFIREIYNEIVTKNPRSGYPERVLVSRSSQVNAQCWGEGTMVVHLGLLDRVSTDSELAFVIAHEMSHQLLNHVNNALIDAFERRRNKNLAKQVQESGKLSVIKSLTYDDYRYTRQNEKQADSLAVVLLRNTQYNWTEYRQVLQMLDSSDYPKNRQVPEIRSFFNFSEYPFRDKWLRPPQSSFGSAAVGNTKLIYERDSLQSHPDIALRIATLDVLFPEETGSVHDSKELPAQLRQRIEMEIPYSSFVLEDYANAMFYTLQTLERYPENLFFKSILVDIWFKLYLARKDHTFSRHVSVSNHYPVMKEELYIFLNNLRLSEIGNITFNYLNRDAVFDIDNDAHYLMLWLISKDLSMENVCIKLETAFAKKFPGRDIEKETWK